MRPTLTALADAQCGVFSRAQALAAGYRRVDIDRLVASGRWLLVARGAYAIADMVSAQEAAPGGLYPLRCAARLLRLEGFSVVSHESAALLHGIALLDPLDGPPRLTVRTEAPASRGQLLGRYVAQLPAEHHTTLDRVPVTTPARAVVDLSRNLDLDAAIVSADSALRLGLDRAALVEVIRTCRRWPGVEQAQQVAMMATRWSESPLESLAMMWFRRQGIPLPDQQLTIRTADGRWLARVDFVWPLLRTVCEVDGQLKYVGADLKDEDSVRRGRALWDEKRREDRIRDTGLEVVRGYWSDRDDDGADLAARLRRAFARGTATALPGTYRIVDGRSHARTGPLAA